MSDNNIINNLSFKSYSDEEVIEQIDKCFTCEEQDIELCFIKIIDRGDDSRYVNLLLKINGHELTVKKYFRDPTPIKRYEMGDKRTSDEAQMEIIKDLIGFNLFEICKVLNIYRKESSKPKFYVIDGTSNSLCTRYVNDSSLELTSDNTDSISFDNRIQAKKFIDECDIRSWAAIVEE